MQGHHAGSAVKKAERTSHLCCWSSCLREEGQGHARTRHGPTVSSPPHTALCPTHQTSSQLPSFMQVYFHPRSQELTSQGNPEPSPAAGKMGVLIYTRKQVKCALTCESRGSMLPPFITAARNPSLSLPLALEVLWALYLCAVTTPSIHEDISSGAMLFP